ncbi:pilin [Nevskia soli]|uniref:pilin n=1 Tax=Nevskia soli TaxID=418856 RepID=UPI000691801B|nr:pilin [Nevskia soli]
MIVVGRDGQAIGYASAAIRYFILLITSYLFPLLLVAFFTRRRQGLHDLAVGSVVLDRHSYDPAHFDYEQVGKSPRGGGAVLVLAIALMVFVFFGGILAAIAIPAYQDYTLRAKIQALIQQADPIKAAVTRHYASSSEPVQYADLGMSGPLALKDDQGLITVNANGVITIMLGMKPPIGQSIRLTPTVSSAGTGWSCVSDDVRKIYLPPSCR